MSNRISDRRPPSNGGTINTRPGNVIRPLYGMVLRDDLAQFRQDISKTIEETNAAIAQGQPRKKAVAGDGVLQGEEVKKAKAAVKDLEKALKALGPDRGSSAPQPTQGFVPPDSTGPGVIRPLYGVVFRDDLARFRDSINASKTEIQAAINGNTLSPGDLDEAKAALKNLNQALKDLGQVTWPR